MADESMSAFSEDALDHAVIEIRIDEPMDLVIRGQ
jgi:hypothetical protein